LQLLTLRNPGNGRPSNTLKFGAHRHSCSARPQQRRTNQPARAGLAGKNFTVAARCRPRTRRRHSRESLAQRFDFQNAGTSNAMVRDKRHAKRAKGG
jgi:hypothetical protein